VKPVYKIVFLTAGLFAAAFMTLMLSSHSPQAASSTMQKEEIETIVREYLIAHPEVVIEAIESYQANQQEIEQRQFEETLKTSKDELISGNPPFAGNPDGDIVIVEFFDYNCGYCKKALEDIRKVLEADKQVKIIFKEMPILSSSSVDAARYALAAHKQEKYFEYHQALMNSNAAKNKETFDKIGKDLGLDIVKLNKDADSKEIREDIEQSLALSRNLGIRGTPAFIIGDTLTPGYVTHQVMLEVINQVRNAKK